VYRCDPLPAERDGFMVQPKALEELQRLLVTVHDPLNWRHDVEKRIKHMSLGRW
jgi:hypothetical protein